MSSTRLLLLGVLQRKSLHGYEVRSELELMGADRWANIAYGSIYYGLSKMADEGFLQVADQPEDTARRGGRVVYEITERGRAEFRRLLQEAWSERRPLIDPFQVALAFMDHVEPRELVVMLRHRIALLEADLVMLDHLVATGFDPPTPRHVIEAKRLAAGHVRAELEWARQALERIERGELP